VGNEVYANGREISCKAAAGKSICAFPDVCLTPPTPPAGPIPIPYPNTGMSSDTGEGSKTVQIGGQEVMLKDSSAFQKSTGDEAATKSQGMNVITHQIQGKCYFTSWSMDVKIEGQNAVRHLDLMTHNHASTPGATPPWPYTDAAAVNPGGVCHGMDHLKLQPYSEKCPPSADGSDRTGHHLIPGRCLYNDPKLSPNYGSSGHNAAPVICVSKGNQHQGSHKLCHNVFDPVELQHAESGETFEYQTARDTAAKSAGQALDPPRDLTKEEETCVKHQLDNHYTKQPPNGPGCTPTTPMAASGARGKALPSSTTPAASN